MYRKLTCFVMFCGCCRMEAVIAAAPPDATAALTRAAKQRCDAARKTYEIYWSYYQDNRVPEELVYRWSRRWLEAERQVSDQKADQIAACASHLDRMLDLERLVTKQKLIRTVTIDIVSSVEFYRSEAEFWLLQAKKDR